MTRMFIIEKTLIIFSGLTLLRHFFIFFTSVFIKFSIEDVHIILTNENILQNKYCQNNIYYEKCPGISWLTIT